MSSKTSFSSRPRRSRSVSASGPARTAFVGAIPNEASEEAPDEEDTEVSSSAARMRDCLYVSSSTDTVMFLTGTTSQFQRITGAWLLMAAGGHAASLNTAANSSGRDQRDTADNGSTRRKSSSPQTSAVSSNSETNVSASGPAAR